MNKETINNKLEEVFFKECKQESPMRCLSVDGVVIWLDFKYPLKDEQQIKIFKSVSLIILAEFKRAMIIKCNHLSYSRIELEKDLLIARAKAGV